MKLCTLYICYIRYKYFYIKIGNDQNRQLNNIWIQISRTGLGVDADVRS